MQCKAQDAVWRAEAAYSCAYDAIVRIEQIQRQMEEMHTLLKEIKAGMAPTEAPKANKVWRIG